MSFIKLRQRRTIRTATWIVSLAAVIAVGFSVGQSQVAAQLEHPLWSCEDLGAAIAARGDVETPIEITHGTDSDTFVVHAESAERGAQQEGLARRAPDMGAVRYDASCADGTIQTIIDAARSVRDAVHSADCALLSERLDQALQMREERANAERAAAAPEEGGEENTQSGPDRAVGNDNIVFFPSKAQLEANLLGLNPDNAPIGEPIAFDIIAARSALSRCS